MFERYISIDWAGGDTENRRVNLQVVERLTLTATETICKCGTDHTVVVQEELESRAPNEETPSPEDECREWKEHEDEYLHSEQDYKREWERMK